MSDESSLESGVMDWAKNVVSAVFRQGYLGGELKAAFLQGTSEIGVALKAFPDAIQVSEPGTAFNPLYRDRDGDTPAHPQQGGVEPMSPSQIAGGGQPQGSVYGEAQVEPTQNLPSPSDISSNPTPPPSLDQGNVYGQDHGKDMGRDI